MDELSYLTLQLVRVCKRYQRQTMARDTVLSALLHDAPAVRAALTEDRLEKVLATADEGASQIVDHEISELEEALIAGIDFRPALQAYLDKNL